MHGSMRPLARGVSALLPAALRSPRPVEKFSKLAQLLGSGSLVEQYHRLIAVGRGVAADEGVVPEFLETCWSGDDPMLAMQLADTR